MISENISSGQNRDVEKSRKLFNQALEMRAQRKQDEANRLFKEAIYYDNCNLEAINQVVGDSTHNTIEEIISILENSIKVFPKEYLLHFKLAMYYDFKNQNYKAIDLYKEIILNDPSYSAAYEILAKEYSLIGELDKAINCFKIGVERCPSDIRLLYGLGIFYLNQKMFYEASKILKKVIEMDELSELAELSRIQLQKFGEDIRIDKSLADD